MESIVNSNLFCIKLFLIIPQSYFFQAKYKIHLRTSVLNGPLNSFAIQNLVICNNICLSTIFINWKQTHNLCLGKPILSDLKRKIQTWTGIRASDLRISSPVLYYLSYRIPVQVQIFLLRSDNHLFGTYQKFFFFCNHISLNIKNSTHFFNIETKTKHTKPNLTDNFNKHAIWVCLPFLHNYKKGHTFCRTLLLSWHPSLL